MFSNRQELMLELVCDTVKYYEANPRAVREGFCVMEDANGNRCAFSRLLIKTEDWEDISSLGDGSPASEVLHDYEVEFHNPAHATLSAEFFDHVQEIHDTITFWKNNKFTSTGKRS